MDQHQRETVVSIAGGFAAGDPSGAAAAARNVAEHPPSETALACALAISRQRVKAAQLVIDGLREQEAALRRKVESLAQTIESTRQHAFHDPLTGLPNRSLLFDRFKQAVAQGKRRDRRIALLFLDLDGFKGINDTLGHAAGDRILQQVAARLTAWRSGRGGSMSEAADLAPFAIRRLSARLRGFSAQAHGRRVW